MFQMDWEVVNVFITLIVVFGGIFTVLLRSNMTNAQKTAYLEGKLAGLTENTTVMPMLEAAYDNASPFAQFPLLAAKNIAEVIKEANIPGVDPVAEGAFNFLVEISDGVPVVKKVEAIEKALE